MWEYILSKLSRIVVKQINFYWEKRSMRLILSKLVQTISHTNY